MHKRQQRQGVQGKRKQQRDQPQKHHANFKQNGAQNQTSGWYHRRCIGDLLCTRHEETKPRQSPSALLLSEMQRRSATSTAWKDTRPNRNLPHAALAAQSKVTSAASATRNAVTTCYIQGAQSKQPHPTRPPAAPAKRNGAHQLAR